MLMEGSAKREALKGVDLTRADSRSCVEGIPSERPRNALSRSWRRVKRARRWVRNGFRLLFRVPAALEDFSKRVELHAALNGFGWDVTETAATWYRAATRGHQQVVVVIGSLGKTTTARAAMNVLTGCTPGWIHASDNCFSLIGLNLMRQGPRARFAVVEAGIGSRGQMARYAAALQPDMAVVTAIATDHLHRLGGAERLWQEKSLMVRALPATGVAILNGDDAAVMRMAEVTPARIVTFGLTRGCDVSADVLEISATGTRFVLRAEGEAWPVRSRLIGRNAIRAQVAAAAAGRAAGKSFREIVDALENQEPTPGRMQPVLLTSGATALCDDFKGSFETFNAALEVLREMKARRRVVVLGSLYRPPPPRLARYESIARHVAEVADRVILVGSRARLFSLGWQGLLDADTVHLAASVGEVTELLRGELRAGDVVLLKGRGEQKLSRIALALSNKDVRCGLEFCRFENVLCQECPNLSTANAARPT